MVKEELDMARQNLLTLNADAFTRFQIVCAEIGKIAKGKKVKILDIGGASTYLYDFLCLNKIDFDLTIVDIVDFDNKPSAATVVIQSAESMDFKNNTFHIVTGIDMLEHIPNDAMKRNIINEAIRVSSDAVIFAGPCDTEAVTRYEKMLNSQNKNLFGSDQKWLAEHFKYGKPSKELIEQCYSGGGLSVVSFSTLSLSTWYVSSIANLLADVSEKVNKKKTQALNKKINQLYQNHDIYIPLQSSSQEGYRTFYIGRKKNSSARQIEEFPGTDIFDSYIDLMAEAVSLTRNFKALETDIDWYKGELERLKKENAELHAQREALEQMKGGSIVSGARRIENKISRKDK